MSFFVAQAIAWPMRMRIQGTTSSIDFVYQDVPEKTRASRLCHNGALQFFIYVHCKP